MTNPGWGGTASEGTPPPQPRCVHHPDRPTALSCTRCGRPACPDCLRAASVGHQCFDCVAAGQRDVPQARTVAGAPVRTQLPTPLLTYVLIAVNVLIFAVTAVQSRSVMDNHIASPLFLDWVLWGPAVAAGEFSRIVTSGFLHIGLMHLAVNMFALYVIGRDTEMVLGRARYLAVYVIALLGGSASVLMLDPLIPTAGASGAIFGLLGAQAVILLRLKRSPMPVLAVIAINVIISVTIPGISLWGHMGGLVAGAAATAALLYVPGAVGARDRKTAGTAGWFALGGVGLLTLVVTAAAVAAI